MSKIVDYALLAGAFFIVLKARQTYNVVEPYVEPIIGIVEKISEWDIKNGWGLWV